MPQDAAFDELRLKDVPAGADLATGGIIDPLAHFAGRANVSFSQRGAPVALHDLSRYIDRGRQTVTSSTGQLHLDYGKGLLTINTPSAQGLSGALDKAGPTELADVVISSAMPLGHIVAVSLDNLPLATSRRILLQVMSEEKATGFRTEPVSEGVQRIVNIGRDPWLIKEFDGKVSFKRDDAARLLVTALDINGDPVDAAGSADRITLRPTTLYYLIETRP